MSERTNTDLEQLHAVLTAYDIAPKRIGAPQGVAPVWPQPNPQATIDEHFRRASLLTAILGMVRDFDLPQICTISLDGWDNKLSGQLSVLNDDHLRREAVAAWLRVLPGAYPHVQVYEDGAARIAARCHMDGVIFEVWATVSEPIPDVLVPAVLPPADPSPLAAQAIVVDPFADTQAFARIPLAGASAAVAPVEQILQEV